MGIDGKTTASLGPQGGSSPESGDPLIGTVLADRYRIIDRLGAGAMGTVYLGEHLKIGRRDAIKLLTGAHARDPEEMARFTRGAKNLALIRHPNVCTVYDFGETADNVQFLAIEYVPGNSLADLVARTGALSPRRAIRIAIQVAHGLQAAHDQGIVHRDLKPDNVMLTHDRDGNDLAKVVDFDIAKGEIEEVGPEVTRMGHVVGTPQYMSPEQLAGDRLDGRSDLYSLGVMFFWMLTGRLPFDGKTAHALMLQRLTQEPLTLQDVSPDQFDPRLDGELRSVLSRDVDGRPMSAGTFAGNLEALFLEPLAPEATRDGEEEPRTQVLLAQELHVPSASPAPVVHATTVVPVSVRNKSKRDPDQGRSHEPGAMGSQTVPRRKSRRPSLFWVATTLTTITVGAALATSGFSVGESGDVIDDRGELQSSASAQTAEEIEAPEDAEIRTAPPATLLANRASADPPGLASAGGAGGRPDESESRKSAQPASKQNSLDPGLSVRPSPSSIDRGDGDILDDSLVLDALKGYAAELAPQNSSAARALEVLNLAGGFWRRPELGLEIRHWAAYTAGLAELNRGAPHAALLWIERAVVLDPENRNYIAVRDALSELNP